MQNLNIKYSVLKFFFLLSFIFLNKMFLAPLVFLIYLSD